LRWIEVNAMGLCQALKLINILVRRASWTEYTDRVARLNGKFRDEPLACEVFNTLA
jgi:hypothetical protein